MIRIFLIIFFLTAIDQISKIAIVATMVENQSVFLIEPILSFKFVYNAGGGLNILEGQTLVLIAFTILGLALLIYLMKDYNWSKNRMYSLSLLLMISGAIGNFIDRIFRAGKVVDFISIDIASWFFPWIFNFADIYLTFGVILFAIDAVFPKKVEDHAN